VHLATDAVAAEFANHRAALANGQLLDGKSDITQSGPVADDRYSGVSAAAREVYEASRFF